MDSKIIIATEQDVDAIARAQEGKDVQEKLLSAMEKSETSEIMTGLAAEARKWEKTIDRISSATGVEKKAQLYITRNRLLEAFTHSATKKKRQDMINFSKELRRYEKAINQKAKATAPQ